MSIRNIAILGATGSIGTQAIDIIRRCPERFHASVLAASSSSEKLFELVRELRPEAAALVSEPEHIPEDLRSCSWFFGPDSAVQALKAVRPQDALCAIVGIAGLDAVWTALDVCERVLLANKEALVTGGSQVMDKAARLGRALLPVDSEHSAIFQCLQARADNPVRRLHLTCSGGALRDRPADRLRDATVRDVLAHPTWSMGSKITVDCATLVNKGLEVIEAHHLFAMPADRIHVVIHPQSVIHSMIEFEDGAILAQLGRPDMRGPISYAMGYPERIPYGGEALDLAAISRLTFAEPDTVRFPGLQLAIDALKAGGSAPVVLNGANEVAVSAFLREQIPFGAITDTIRDTLSSVAPMPVDTIEAVHAADIVARERAVELLKGRMR